MNKIIAQAMREKTQKTRKKALTDKAKAPRPSSTLCASTGTPDEPPVTPSSRRRKVVDAILTGSNTTTALESAGYSPTNPANVLRHREVIEYLQAARAEIEEHSTLTRLDVLKVFLEAIDLARTLADPGQMIAGAREIGKMMGYYEPERFKVEVEATPAKYREMSDEELFRLAKPVEGETVQ
jgi:phage terminase small subunit